MSVKFQSMKHLKISAPPKGDGLEIMLNKQKEINSRIYENVLNKIGYKDSHYDLIGFSDDEKESLSKEYLLAIMRECVEALDLINSKPWKQSKIEVDEVEFKYELIDIQHFINTLYDVWGMDRNEVLSFYISKNKENHARVSRKY